MTTATQELAPVQTGMSIAQQIDFANMVAPAAMLPNAYRNRPADIMVAMGLGSSMGLSPMESLYRINVIQGKPTASAELIAAQVRKAGHKLRITKDEASQSVTATIVRADDPDYPFTATRDRAWAESMGLASKDNYRKQPMTMLTWRAITAVAREACPEALFGVAYTPDEMTDFPSKPDPVPVAAEVTPQQPIQAQAAPRAAQAAPAPQQAPAGLSEERKAFMAKSAQRIADATGRDLTEIKRELMEVCGNPLAVADEQWGEYQRGVLTIADGMCRSFEQAIEPDVVEQPQDIQI